MKSTGTPSKETIGFNLISIMASTALTWNDERIIQHTNNPVLMRIRENMRIKEIGLHGLFSFIIPG